MIDPTTRGADSIRPEAFGGSRDCLTSMVELTMSDLRGTVGGRPHALETAR